MLKKDSLNVFLILFNLITGYCINLKYRFYLIVLLSIFSSFLEILSIGFLIPLIGIIFNDVSYTSYSFFKYFIDISPKDMIIYFILAIIFSSIFRIFLLRLSHKYAYMLGNYFSVRIFKNFFNQDYFKIKSKNVNSILDLTLTKNNFLSFSFVLFIGMTVSLITTLIIVLFLFALNGLIAFGIFFITILIYLIVNYFSKKYISSYSLITSNESINITHIVTRTFGLIKELKLLNKFSYFLKSFTNSDEKMRESMASTNFLSQFPRIAIESLLICLISLLLLFTHNDQKMLQETVPLIFIFIFSLQKILPFVQNAYGSFTNILGYKDSIYACYSLINEDPEPRKKIKKRNFDFQVLELRNINFSYPNSKYMTLKNLSLKIKKNDYIGIYGKSGSGKTTFLEIFSSLIVDINGDVFIDKIKSDFDTLSKLIFYVPSNVFIFDGTLAQNISLSFDGKNIDLNKIKKITKMVGLDSLKLSSKLTDFGSNLSMGQIQRIGIARALYSNAKIIVLDEPTSSLDQKNEALIMTTLKKLKNNITILMVSHKKEPLKLCNKLYQYRNGNIYGKNSI